MSRYSATQWDTHKGYFITVCSETPLDVDRMTEAIAEVVQCHGALRIAFTWNEELGKLEQIVYPDIDFNASFPENLIPQPRHTKRVSRSTTSKTSNSVVFH